VLKASLDTVIHEFLFVVLTNKADHVPVRKHWNLKTSLS
jgi:hypothetical protein